MHLILFLHLYFSIKSNFNFINNVIINLIVNLKINFIINFIIIIATFDIYFIILLQKIILWIHIINFLSLEANYILI